MAFKSLKDQTNAISKIMQDDKSIPYYRFKFGKHKGSTLEYVFKQDKSYLEWIYKNFEDIDPVLESFIHERVI